MPAQVALVKNAPEITESRGKCGQIRCQHPPAARATIQRRAIKPSQSQPRGTKSWSRARVHHKQELITRPQHDCDRSRNERNAPERQRPANGVEAKENCGKRGERG